eukprot:Nk52_evm21s2325 gene=Nk52_evmTU21s2325
MRMKVAKGRMNSTRTCWPSWVVAFVVVIFLAKVDHPAFVLRAAAETGTIELPIGVILPFSTAVSEGKDIRVAIRIAAKHIVSKKILPDNVKLITTPETDLLLDDESRPLIGLRHATNLILQKDVCFLLGAWNSAVSIQIATYAASVGIIQISGGSTSRTLSLKKSYPSFVRSTSPSTMLISYLLKLCQVYKWDEIAIISTDDVFGLDAVSEIREFGPTFGLRVAIQEKVPFNIALLDAYNEVRAALTRIKNSGFKVILLPAVIHDAIEIMKIANEIGLLSGEFQWIQRGWTAVDLGEKVDFEEKLYGLIGAAPYYQNTEEYREYVRDYQDEFPKEYSAVKEAPEFFTLEYYDGLIMFARALNATSRRLATLSISSSCLQVKNAALSECKLPSSEREAIYQSAVQNNYQGVLEYMTLLPTSEATPDGKLYGIHSSFPQAMILFELYKLSYRGASGFITLTSVGDVPSAVGIINYQPASSKDRATAGHWTRIGVGLSVNGSLQIDFEDSESTLMLAGSTRQNIITDPSVFTFQEAPDQCDLANENQFSLFENASYAMDNFSSGVALITVFSILITVSSLLALVYSIIILRTKEQAQKLSIQKDFRESEPGLKKSTSSIKAQKSTFMSNTEIYDTVISNNANNSIVTVLLFEYIFFVFISLQANMEWLNNQGSDSVIKDVANLSLGGILFFFNYVWVIVLLLWCIYCLIYILRLSPQMKTSYVGVMFLHPSIFYLRVIGTVGVLPIVSSLLKLFNCSYIEPLGKAVLVGSYCEHDCFTNEHKGLLVIGGTLLAVFLSLNIITAHIWQELTLINAKFEERELKFKAQQLHLPFTDTKEKGALCITIRREFILTSHIMMYLLVANIAFLRLYPIYLLSVNIALLMARELFLVLHLPNSSATNVKWVNSIFHAQAIGGIGTSVVALVAEVAGVEEIWPIGLVMAWAIIVFSATLYLVRRQYRLSNKCFYCDSTAKEIEKSRKYSRRRDSTQLTRLVDELTKGTKVPSDNDSVASDLTEVTTVDGASGLNRALQDQLVNAKYSFRSYCQAIQAYPDDAEFLFHIFSAALDFSKGLISVAEENMKLVEEEEQEGKSENRKAKVSALREQNAEKSYKFMNSVSAFIGRKGVRLRTPFLVNTPSTELIAEGTGQSLRQAFKRGNMGRESSKDSLASKCSQGSQKEWGTGSRFSMGALRISRKISNAIEERVLDQYSDTQVLPSSNTDEAVEGEAPVEILSLDEENL